MRIIPFLAVLALACGDKETAGTDTGAAADGGGEGAAFEDFVDVTEAPIGDFGTFEGFESAGEWMTQDVDASKAQLVSFDGIVEDFESGDGVSDATLDFWWSDTTSGPPDASYTTGGGGTVSGSELMVCSPVAYRVTTDPALGETKDTFELHTVYGSGDSASGEQYNSVSSTTYAIIPSLLGVSPESDKGIAAGTAFDFNGDKIEGAQVVIRDEVGVIPEGLVVRYFVEDFPNRGQLHTSADGLWIAINIPPGSWFAEMWVSDGAGGHVLMGRSTVEVGAESINIANIYTGFGDGVKYPDSCLSGS